MNTSGQIPNSLTKSRLLLLALILLVITFPDMDPSYSIKIDPAIHWAWNYLFATDLQLGKEIIFPHGPMAFLMYPLPIGSNLVIGLAVLAFIRFLFAFCFLYLGALSQTGKTWLHFILCFLILKPLFLIFVMIGLVALSVLLHLETKQRYWLWLAILLTAIGLYVKASIGVTAMIIVGSYLLINLWKVRNFLLILKSIGVGLFLVVGIWLLMFQDLSGIVRYFYGILELTKGNSSAACLYPENNWWLLSGSILAFVFLPVTLGDKKSVSAFIILCLSVFAIWKHAMCRQDPWHMIGLFYYLIMVFGMLIIIAKSVRILPIFLMAVTLLLFYFNFKFSVGLFPNTAFNLNGVKHFSEVFFDYSNFRKNGKEKSVKNIAACHLDEDAKAIIGDASIDIYPWNYTFIPANDFNWQPRPVIQSYAAYTSWLDQEDATHFASPKAPDFILWDLDIAKRDVWRQQLPSIDNRYLLNDEPFTINAILNHYKLVKKDSTYLLFAKSEEPYFATPQRLRSEQSKWNEWISVPYFGDGILKTKIEVKSTFRRLLKNQWYKDEMFFVEYKLENGDLKKSRVIPSALKNGVWVNPYIMSPSNDVLNPIASSIRFTCSNPKMVTENFALKWEFSPVLDLEQKEEKKNPGYTKAFAWWGKNLLSKDSLYIHSINDAEKSVSTYWTSKKSKQIETNAHSGSWSFELKPGDYSSTFSIPLSKLVADSIYRFKVSASVQVNMNYHAKGNLVIAIEQNGKSIFWDASKVQNFVSIYNCWSPVFLESPIFDVLSEDAILKGYIWNNSKESFYVDDLEVKIYKVDERGAQ